MTPAAGKTAAERYAAARARTIDSRTALHEFRGMYEFGLDDFQVHACRSVESGRGVLVAAPTGAGKTVVGEFAVHMALRDGRKCFYTTPIKALSNQKFHDLVARYGVDKIGLLTGDNSINSEAPIVVMTTEVLRNMIYAGSRTLDGLAYVVMDEVHYLADRFRGAVWEEVIIHLPEHVSVVALSATVSNAEEFGDWLDQVRGDTDVVVSEHRPVPLWQHVMAGSRLYDLFVDDEQHEVNPELLRIARDEHRIERTRDTRPRRGQRRPRSINTPRREEVIERLDRAGLLPAITFIFSRAGCDGAVEQCLRSGIRLTTPNERDEIRRIVEERCADLPPEDAMVLDYISWSDALQRGVAAHHAGLIPKFKEVVEELFQRGLIKAIFATETLALGINMPARSVVLEKLVKWNGETHADITPGEYTQLTGRAGRRGLDVEGHAVVVWHPGIDPRSVAGLASTRTYPLRSSFRPSYNMAVNLVGQVGRHAARELLETSFAQFQADRAVVGLARQLRKQEEALEGYRASMSCHLGDFEEYARLRAELSGREKALARGAAAGRRSDSIESLTQLRPGDVIFVPAGRRSGGAVILDVGLRSPGDEPRPYVLTVDKQVRRLSVVDFPVAVEPVAHLKIPKTFNARSPHSRRDLASALREKLSELTAPKGKRHSSGAGDDDQVLSLRKQLRAHPCHGCDEREDHARWAERYHRLRRETDQLSGRIEGRTNTIAREFDRVCEVLAELGYLTTADDSATVTDAGRALARIYAELDLLVAQCLRDQVWVGLSAAELASCAAALVYESRRDDEGESPRLPRGAVQDALAQMMSTWGDLVELENDHRLSYQRQPDLGFSWAAFRWASGHRLDAVLRDVDMAAGDFVRWCKQLIDLLDQIADAAADGSDDGEELSRTARKAVASVRRGVVSFSSVS